MKLSVLLTICLADYEKLFKEGRNALFLSNIFLILVPCFDRRLNLIMLVLLKMIAEKFIGQLQTYVLFMLAIDKESSYTYLTDKEFS
mgnify:CR=1 FL=1